MCTGTGPDRFVRTVTASSTSAHGWSWRTGSPSTYPASRSRPALSPCKCAGTDSAVTRIQSTSGSAPVASKWLPGDLDYGVCPGRGRRKNPTRADRVSHSTCRQKIRERGRWDESCNGTVFEGIVKKRPGSSLDRTVGLGTSCGAAPRLRPRVVDPKNRRDTWLASHAGQDDSVHV